MPRLCPGPELGDYMDAANGTGLKDRGNKRRKRQIDSNNEDDYKSWSDSQLETHMAW
jgi:hypothetical protein